jgi:ubiquinone/menaquinone biosynthesis C-methylase UbiE
VSLRARFFAASYDHMCKGPEQAGLGAHRETLLAHAYGRVLEVGAGTGANLAYYGDGVEELVLAEPSEPMARRLGQKLAAGSRRAEVVPARAEKLPFPDASFDTVVATLVLCSVEDQPRALGEIRRVLRPGGKLLFIEHVRADEPKLARWQDRMNPINRVVADGCNCNRATLDAVGAAGFRVTELVRDRMRKAPPFVAPLAIGTAQAG